jgi:hypothetical protein
MAGRRHSERKSRTGALNAIAHPSIVQMISAALEVAAEILEKLSAVGGRNENLCTEFIPERP